MTAVKCNVQENYTIKLHESKLYIDFTNDRLKLLDYSPVSASLPKDIIQYAVRLHLGKVIFNCPSPYLKSFQDSGYVVEGRINGYFCGEDAYCVSSFVNKDRAISHRLTQENNIVNTCTGTYTCFIPTSDQSITIRNANINDIPEMIKLFAEVFKTYPSPVFSSEYLQRVMCDQILFKVAVMDNKIVSIASADMDKKNLNAEMTDCATYPEYTRRGILSNLIYSLECDLRKKGFYTLYSLSRAIHPGINMALCKHGYQYSGRLINNCDICGGFEDMNIWVKKLR